MIILTLLPKRRFDLYLKKQDTIKKISDELSKSSVSPNDFNLILSQKHSSLIKQSTKASKLLLRPELNISDFLEYSPTLKKISSTKSNYYTEIIKSVEINFKYKNYIDREKQFAEKINRLEKIQLPHNINYNNIQSISTEAKQKLDRIKPKTIAQASRIPGVSPSDINTSLLEKSDDVFGYILPGLIDSHIHIESSMLVPSRFSEFALKHGVVSVVADPHEISNVLGVDGFSFMLEDSKMTPLKIHFAVPSCVPATSFETSGAVFSPQVVDDLLSYPKVVALGEMMNFPGVIHNDKDVIKMIESAVNKNKVVDGHAPSLSGDDLLINILIL